MSQPAAPRIDQTGWLVAHGLAKRFGSKTVVHDVSIAVRRGEAVGLLGPNGAGKTTVFTIIMGLVRPDGGEVLLDGRPITRLPLFQRGRLGIGYLPQEPSIFRGLSVRGNILAVLETHMRSRQARRARLATLLDEFGLTHLAQASALALSGGSGGASRSPAPWPATRSSCCSTSPSPASIPSPSPTSRRWCGN